MWMFCTAGRGTEAFAAEELTQKSSAYEIVKADGKVHFQADDSDPRAISDLLRLKCIERLFVKVYCRKNFVISKHVTHYIFQEVHRIEWRLKLENWKKFQTRAEETETEEPKAKKPKVEQPSSSSVTFRVSCKLAGHAANKLDAQEVCKCFAKALQGKYGWKVNLKNPTLEIFSQINNDGWIIGMAVTKKPLSERPYLKHIGLRSPVAWIVASLADIQNGDVVLDPMCGAGTILVEGYTSWRDALYMGADIQSTQLVKSVENADHSEAARHTGFVQSRVTRLPFRDGAFDVCVCDTPFGINHSTVEQVLDLYPAMLRELNRVLVTGARIVLLTSEALKDQLLDQISSTCGPQSKPNSTHASQTVDGQSSGAYASQTAQGNTTSVSSDTHTSKQETEETTWTLKRSSYLKLGETDAHVLAFTKEKS